MENNAINIQRDDFENIEEAWKGDLWDRKRLGEQLERYVDRLQCGAVLALDAKWGEGKTWFVRHWAKHLADTDHNVIYLDAFANDYLDDPFLTIAAEISQALRNSDKISDSDIKEFDSKTASLLISLMAVIPMIAAKAGMHWVGLGGAGEAIQDVYHQGKDIFDTASDEIASKVKEQIEKKIENHHIEKQTIQDFKKELTDLTAQLEKPLVFIIDELDRCRPDFAIRLIERIKHFFDIKNIVFVLVMNKPQLLQSVKKYYGYDSQMNGDYLEKFIDFTINFPKVRGFNIYDNVIREQLFRIGELDDIEVLNQFYYLVLALQLLKNLNSRELIKLINQYALLRVEDTKKNIILITLLFDNQLDNNFLNYRRLIDVLYVHLGGVDDSYMTKEYFITNKLASEKGVNIVEFLEYFSSINNISTQYTTVGQSNDKERLMVGLLKLYSVKKLNSSKDFIGDWKQYIRTGIF